MKYRCPKCGKEIEISEQELTTLKNHIVCPQCLSTLKIDGDYAYIPLDFDEATPPVNSTKPAEPEVTCPSCGKTLHGNPNFCPECGHKFVMSCPNCGKEVPPGAKFCLECGEKL